MKFNTFIFATFLASTLISGCGSVASGVKFGELNSATYRSASVGKIVVYRPNRVTGSGDRMNIFVNDASYGALQPLGFKVIDAPAGKVVIHTDTSGIDRPLEITVDAGSTIYLKTEFSNYVMVGAWDLTKIDERLAKVELSGLRESK